MHSEKTIGNRTSIHPLVSRTLSFMCIRTFTIHSVCNIKIDSYTCKIKIVLLSSHCLSATVTVKLEMYIIQVWAFQLEVLYRNKRRTFKNNVCIIIMLSAILHPTMDNLLYKKPNNTSFLFLFFCMQVCKHGNLTKFKGPPQPLSSRKNGDEC
jgi:hypothetical protein